MSESEEKPEKKEFVYKPSTKQKQNERWSKIKDDYAWVPGVDYRVHPEKYKVGKGEQGVLICQPYKSEILPYWRFKNPEIAKESSEKLFALFEEYLKKNEFVGADMTRKFIQMGYTRSRRYANHKTGRKYDAITGEELPLSSDNNLKAESARIFFSKWKEAEENSTYKKMKSEWKIKYG